MTLCLLLAWRIEPVPFDSECNVDPRAVVLPGTDRSHLDNLGRLEVLLQSADECFVNRWRCGRDSLGVFQRQLLLGAECGMLAPGAFPDRADLGVADAIVAAPGSVQVLSERAANDRADPQVEQVAEPD